MGLLTPLSTFANATVTVTRYAAGSMVDGVLVPGAATTFNNVALSVRPLNAKDLKALPQGYRVEDTKVTMGTFVFQPDDIITGYKSETWRVFAVREWDVRGQVYARAMFTRTRIGGV